MVGVVVDVAGAVVADAAGATEITALTAATAVNNVASVLRMVTFYSIFSHARCAMKTRILQKWIRSGDGTVYRPQCYTIDGV
jgi:hypothetical protein